MPQSVPATAWRAEAVQQAIVIRDRGDGGAMGVAVGGASGGLCLFLRWLEGVTVGNGCLDGTVQWVWARWEKGE